METTTYLNSLEKALSRGDSTEHTHRPALKNFLESVHSSITATNEPKRSDCGAPDFVVSQGKGHISLTIGYVEAKDVGISLDGVERSEQLARYRKYLQNLILTDYLEFRWYVDGEKRLTANLARQRNSGKLKKDKKGIEEVEQLIQAFLEHEPEKIAKPQNLAIRMARLTHMIRDIIVESIESGKASNTLTDLRKAFAQTLIPDLDLPKKTAEFADMYAQTIAYGLFAARCNHRGTASFRRLGAAAEIPKTNPFLRKLFETITGADLDEEPYAGFVDDLADLLNHTDMAAVLEQFGKRTRQEDPVVHFYETFLAAYDPKLRETRGVYYTPEPVVSYIVRSVDHLLKSRFDCPEGLADTSTCEIERSGNGDDTKTETSHRVLILDPACGTGTFLYAVVNHIREQFMKTGNAGMWSGYVRNHLLPRLFGFELLMAPYAVAHFKLSMQLAGHDLESDELRKNWAYDFAGGVEDRLRVYLTNTLEGMDREIQRLLGPFAIISDEANAAREVKRQLPIMVVTGNPPYSGHSANRSYIEEIIPPGGTYNVQTKKGQEQRTAGKNGKKLRYDSFIGRLIREYHKVDGEPLGEKNPKWLQDDYVKFIRWATWRIDRTGAGILAFITNHSYLDNPTFRGMRRHLMQSFTDIYILNLHGNAKKKETCPDGSKDKNVFDIQQGVAIGIFVKDPKKPNPARIYHTDLWGLREDKYERLLNSDIKSTKWEQLGPTSPQYLFVPQNIELANEYELGWRIPDIMAVNSIGIITARDGLTIGWSRDAVWALVQKFARLSEEQARATYDLGDDAQDWKVSLAQKDVKESGPDESNLSAIQYRPFDGRFTYYTGNSRGFMCRPRSEVMNHMRRGANLGFHLCRQIVSKEWRHVMVTNCMTDDCYVSNKTRERGYTFPLYLYSAADKNGSLFANGASRNANVNPKFVDTIAASVGLVWVDDTEGDLEKSFGPEDVFNYIYSILLSSTYRERYREFLKRDFPRVPLTSDKELFRLLCELGSEMVALHLLESPLLVSSNFITSYPVPGDDLIGNC